jgi:hypothetical protein
MQQMAARYGYQEFTRALNKDLQRTSQRMQLPITRQETRSAKLNQSLESRQSGLRQVAKATKVAHGRVGQALAVQSRAALYARQSQALLLQQRALSRVTGLPVDRAISARAEHYASQASDAQRELRQAKVAFRSSKRELGAANRQNASRYAMAVATQSSVQRIAAYQAAQYEAVRLRARRKLASWS